MHRINPEIREYGSWSVRDSGPTVWGNPTGRGIRYLRRLSARRGPVGSIRKTAGSERSYGRQVRGSSTATGPRARPSSLSRAPAGGLTVGKRRKLPAVLVSQVVILLWAADTTFLSESSLLVVVSVGFGPSCCR